MGSPHISQLVLFPFGESSLECSVYIYFLFGDSSESYLGVNWPGFHAHARALGSGPEYLPEYLHEYLAKAISVL